jgi:hypothetical protein
MQRLALSALIAFVLVMYASHSSAGEMSGKWLLRATHGNKTSSQTQMNIIQNGSEVVFTSKAVSNKDIPGQGWGRVIVTEKGKETVSTPAVLVEMTRVDTLGNYIAKFIGVVDSNTKISGYFVDANGARGSFVMEKQSGNP